MTCPSREPTPCRRGSAGRGRWSRNGKRTALLSDEDIQGITSVAASLLFPAAKLVSYGQREVHQGSAAGFHLLRRHTWVRRQSHSRQAVGQSSCVCAKAGRVSDKTPASKNRPLARISDIGVSQVPVCIFGSSSRPPYMALTRARGATPYLYITACRLSFPNWQETVTAPNLAPALISRQERDATVTAGFRT